MPLMFLYFLLSLKNVLDPTTPLDCCGGTFRTSSAMSLSLKLDGEKTWFGAVLWFILSKGSGAHSFIPDLYEACLVLDLFILMGSFPEMPEGYFTDATEIYEL